MVQIIFFLTRPEKLLYAKQATKQCLTDMCLVVLYTQKYYFQVQQPIHT